MARLPSTSVPSPGSAPKTAQTLPDHSPTTWNAAVRQIFQDQYALMVRKQTDYGPGNISAFGELGVLVRLSDKLERLKNLLLTRDAQGRITMNPAAPANESVEDSYRDLLNYALIALMVRQGQWDLPFVPEDQEL